MDRLQMLMAAHYEFVRAAGLPEGSRPYGAMNRLEEIEKLMMEEIRKEPTIQTNTRNDDDAPF